MAYSFCISEEGAKTKWCPMTFGLPEIRYHSGGDPIRKAGPWTCVGSACMAWRWVQTNVDDGNGGTVSSYNTHGYCGMAGEPWIRK